MTATRSPRFSVLIPCRNAAATLTETLASVRAQTRADWEVVAVDDGSTDETARILAAASAEDRRVRVVSGPRRGPGAARNVAAAAARGELLAFLDADDLWAPDRLAAAAETLAARPDATAVFARVAFFADDPARSDARSAVWRRDPTARDLLLSNPACTSSNLVVRRAAFEAAGGFREDLWHAEDVELMLRLLPEGALAPDARTLVHYRASAGGLSSDLDAMMEGWRACVKTAGAIGRLPSARDLRAAEASQLRYLARRALRLRHDRRAALSYALRGLGRSPAGFFSAPRQGALTLAAALVSAAFPRRAAA